MLIRHAEKPDGDGVAGVKEDGSTDKHSITVRGWQRAGALVPFFARPAHPKIARPNVIYAAAPTDNPEIKPEDAKSLRPQETVAPVAARLGCRVRTDVRVGDETALVEALRGLHGIVLVAWEHKRIPIIAGSFAAAPAEWGDAFDVVWVLDRNPDGSYEFSTVRQDLLCGDTPGP